MPIGDNPFDDGLDFVGCPPKPADLKLPDFPGKFKGDCKLICWGRCQPFPDGSRTMYMEIEGFRPDPNQCGVYTGMVNFIDATTHENWYKGELKFYYTRNYIYTGTTSYQERRKSIAFRFVVKGDIVRTSDKMPEWSCYILCTKKQQEVKPYEEIFVYGGFDLFFDIEFNKMTGFTLSLGHNDGWYTHHPKCSKRPIDWAGQGDYIGHYSDRGWLFVSPGKTFVFDPSIRPPTGRFSEEAVRKVGKECHSEEAINYGELKLAHIRCIHSYQLLKGMTECETPFGSEKFCQGLVYSGEKQPWITFFSMGYWMDRYEKKEQSLHLVEGNIQVEKGLYEFYGFSTLNYQTELKLVDLASNRDVIGAPVDTDFLLYLYNVDIPSKNPPMRMPVPLDTKLSEELLRKEKAALKDKETCPFSGE